MVITSNAAVLEESISYFERADVFEVALKILNFERSVLAVAGRKEQLLDVICIPTLDSTKNGYETVTYEQKYCKGLVKCFKKYGTIVLKSHLGSIEFGRQDYFSFVI